MNLRRIRRLGLAAAGLVLATSCNTNKAAPVMTITSIVRDAATGITTVTGTVSDADNDRLAENPAPDNARSMPVWVSEGNAKVAEGSTGSYDHNFTLTYPTPSNRERVCIWTKDYTTYDEYSLAKKVVLLFSQPTGNGVALCEPEVPVTTTTAAPTTTAPAPTVPETTTTTAPAPTVPETTTTTAPAPTVPETTTTTMAPPTSIPLPNPCPVNDPQDPACMGT
jgi:hypothetical protein